MSTIESIGGSSLVSAWQASSISEGCNDQSIFFSRSDNLGVNWTTPTLAQNTSLAVWGPVLHFQSKTKTLWMFFSQSTKYQNRPDPNCESYGRSYPGGELLYHLK
eukprot:m.7668 g.7668  ORF g.7668 m.7668 type:complete len:105 (-) comp5858_c0_seq1:693-1007(-)